MQIEFCAKSAICLHPFAVKYVFFNVNISFRIPEIEALKGLPVSENHFSDEANIADFRNITEPHERRDFIIP
jgi:hypothetical protein